MSENGKSKRGRPLQRDLWAASMWDALWTTHPDGLTPSDLRNQTGLSHAQVQDGAKYLRQTFSEEPHPPVIYVRVENKWYIAPSWGEHTRQAIRAEYLQQSAARLHSAEQLLAQAERAFPGHARRIRKVVRNTAYLREETEDLITDLAEA